MEKVKATFIGENGSLGYVNGKEYTLEIVGSSIRRGVGDGVCKYQSINSFLKNWTNIKQI